MLRYNPKVEIQQVCVVYFLLKIRLLNANKSQPSLNSFHLRQLESLKYLIV